MVSIDQGLLTQLSYYFLSEYLSFRILFNNPHLFSLYLTLFRTETTLDLLSEGDTFGDKGTDILLV